MSERGIAIMRIVDLEPLIVHVNRRGDWVFVLVHTDQGITGLGEASHSSNDALLVAALAQMKRRLVGQDPLRLRAIWESLTDHSAGRVWQTALSGVEQALWDVMGQHLDVPLHVLFGGALRQRIRLYANINRHVNERSPEGFARAARQAVDEGFTAVKLAPFDEVRAPDRIRTGPLAAWREGVERVRAVRQSIGDDVELLVDCHGRFEASEAALVARELAGCRLHWFEEPVPDRYPEALERVTATSGIPTASGENAYGVEGFLPFLSRPTVDIIMPDVKHDGGLWETLQIAAAARMRGVPVAPHNPAGPVATVSTAQAISTVSNFLILEYAWGEAEWRADLLEPRERIEAGHLILPEGPGLGHRLNMAMVDAHRIDAPSETSSARVAPV
jgi:galactonate dehydratase